LLCTSACKCINCGNNDGLDHQPEVSSTTEKEKRRKRAKHIEQEFIREEGWKFMKKNKLLVDCGLRENIIFSWLQSYFSEKLEET